VRCLVRFSNEMHECEACVRSKHLALWCLLGLLLAFLAVSLLVVAAVAADLGLCTPDGDRRVPVGRGFGHGVDEVDFGASGHLVEGIVEATVSDGQPLVPQGSEGCITLRTDRLLRGVVCLRSMRML